MTIYLKRRRRCIEDGCTALPEDRRKRCPVHWDQHHLEVHRAKQGRKRARRRVRNEWEGEITYVIWSPVLGLYKIGHSVALKQRLSVLRGGGCEPELICTFPRGRSLEHHLHDTLAEYRRQGEWFALPPAPDEVEAWLQPHVHRSDNSEER